MKDDRRKKGREGEGERAGGRFRSQKSHIESVLEDTMGRST